MVPAFDGANLSREWKEALWARFYTQAPSRIKWLLFPKRAFVAIVTDPAAARRSDRRGINSVELHDSSQHYFLMLAAVLIIRFFAHRRS